MERFLGLLCALGAAVAFGLQYVPVKKYEIFDGVTFQWFMCGGILMIGFLCSIVFGNFGMTNQEDALLIIEGGALWALSNYLVLPLVKLLGIGLGFSLYHFVNLMVGYGLKNEEADAKDKIHVSPKMEEGWPQSWRLLRSQVEAHCLRWRLQRERCRSESLQQEVDMRSQRNADLQRQLEAAHAELALLKSQGGGPGAGSAGSAGTATSSPRRRGAAGAPASSAKSKMVRMQSTPVLHSSDGTTSPRHGDQLRALREAQCALRGENLELKQELAQKEQQMAALSADLASSRLRVAAKSHEANVKDALLSCLQKEAWQPSERCDEELEKLVAAVATPLLGALRLAPPSPSFGAFGAGAAGWSASLPVGTMSGGAASPMGPSHFSSICVLPGMPAPMAHR